MSETPDEYWADRNRDRARMTAMMRPFTARETAWFCLFGVCLAVVLLPTMLLGLAQDGIAKVRQSMAR